MMQSGRSMEECDADWAGSLFDVAGLGLGSVGVWQSMLQRFAAVKCSEIKVDDEGLRPTHRGDGVLDNFEKS